MEISRDGRPTYAAAVCSSTDNPAGAWSLHIVNDVGEMSEALTSWPVTGAPLPLLSRYDALALLGFAPVTGGAEAWTWQEGDGVDGGSYWVGMTPIRPLSQEERARAVSSSEPPLVG
ncbi:hypothetical protein ACFV0B_06735 [Streptomyces xanthophaeus]|uniref:hypothetical protein n=1 Tax=Streptomyces xanthophaeus TaxID=67385 RepID=UPI003687F780